MQLQSRKVDNVEDGNRHFREACEGKGLKGGRMNNIQDCIFHFTAKTIPIPIHPTFSVHSNQKTLQTT